MSQSPEELRRRIERSDCLSVREGRLFVEDMAASDIVGRFGSPIFVLSEAQLRGNYRRWRDALAGAWPEGPVDVLPAFKANLSLAARRVLSAEGAGAEAGDAEGEEAGPGGGEAAAQGPARPRAGPGPRARQGDPGAGAARQGRVLRRGRGPRHPGLSAHTFYHISLSTPLQD